MQARYPKNIVLLVEGLVAPLDDDAAIRWMRERAESLRSNADVPHACQAKVPQRIRDPGARVRDAPANHERARLVVRLLGHTLASVQKANADRRRNGPELV